MTLYQEVAQPVIHADPEWQRLVAEEAALRAKLLDVVAQRQNLESRIACRLLYPSAED